MMIGDFHIRPIVTSFAKSVERARTKSARTTQPRLADSGQSWALQCNVTVRVTIKLGPVLASLAAFKFMLSVRLPALGPPGALSNSLLRTNAPPTNLACIISPNRYNSDRGCLTRLTSENMKMNISISMSTSMGMSMSMSIPQPKQLLRGAVALLWLCTPLTLEYISDGRSRDEGYS